MKIKDVDIKDQLSDYENIIPEKMAEWQRRFKTLNSTLAERLPAFLEEEKNRKVEGERLNRTMVVC
ncbi:hypothetical protein C0584_04865 [Candidatus Parcubacteria bacterium]|nr:MAG: hypothetical protein C0584_04865 [Candidatus Parcubacteria bacterium]